MIHTPKRVVWLDLPVRASVPMSYACSIDELMFATGENTGNLVFRKGLECLIDTNSAQLADPRSADAILYGSGDLPDLVLISCANWIGEADSFEESNYSRSEVLSRRPLNLLPIGLGIQATIGNQQFHIRENTRRLLSILSEYSGRISVRCAKTAECLQDLGITNYLITGCPSNFISKSDRDHLEITYGDRLQTMRLASSWNELRLVVNEPPEGHSSDHLFLSAFTELASSIVVQTPSGISSVRYQQNGRQANKKPSRFSLEAKRKITYFFDVDAWLEHSYSSDAIIGHRMHANMVGLQAGTPSLLIVHDARLQGLADTMQIPVITEAEAHTIATSSPSFFADIFEAQVSAYLARRDELFDKFLELFGSIPNVDPFLR